MNSNQQIVASQVKELLELLPVIQELQKQIPDGFPDIKTAVDTAYLCRKCEDILKTVRVKIEEVGKQAEAFCCMVLASLELDNYKTENCTASPNPSIYCKFPQSPRDEGFMDFVKQLPLEALRPHYPTVSELITKEVAEGNQLPFGLDAKSIVSTENKLRILSKKEL